MRIVRNLSEVFDQEPAVNLLKKALEKGRVAHSYLFYGPKGVGKETTARAFLYHLFCQMSHENPCGSCIACKKLDKEIHPDVVKVLPEKRDIRIDTIREIERFIRFRPLEAPYKVILIHQAEKLNPEAGNALLKSLEEPPPYVIFILLTENLTLLLPTIVSRSQLVKFRPLRESTIRDFLVKYYYFEESLAETLASLSQGSLGRALEIAEKGLLEELNAFVKAGASFKAQIRFKTAERLAKLDRENYDLFFFLIALWIWKSYLKERYGEPYPKGLPEEIFKGDPKVALKELSQAKAGLDYFLNPELTFYTLMLKLFPSKDYLAKDTSLKMESSEEHAEEAFQS